VAVRAKFKVQRIEAMQHQRARRGEDGKPNYQDAETVEMRTVVLSPVYGNGDPDHENTKFWEASPSGEIKLGTINPAAWEAFDLGREFYIDFTPAD
jgi:hypothetical protein